jgi:uncharacterized protein YecT (DUF1311 family)
MMLKQFFTIATLFGATVVHGEQHRELLLATSPSGSFSLRCKEKSGAIWVVPRGNESARAKLPGAAVRLHEYGNWQSGLRDRMTNELDTLEDVPLSFISPDENWIFVQMNLESAFQIGLLYSRASNASNSVLPEYQLRASERLDELAWRLFCDQTKIPMNQLAVMDSFGNRDMSVTFGAWSHDSCRLLLALDGGIGAREEPMGPFPKSILKWLCYFNTRTGAMELTERLHVANKGTIAHRDPSHIYAEEDKREIIDAEAVGEEGPVPSSRTRFRAADAALKQIYSKLLSRMSANEKENLKKQQQRWLKQRDLFAAIHQNQSWSLFRYASESEGRAIATEKRVTELRKILDTAH